jgi:hypothetical protein
MPEMTDPPGPSSSDDGRVFARADHLWIAIRLFGMYLLYQAMMSAIYASGFVASHIFAFVLSGSLGDYGWTAALLRIAAALLSIGIYCSCGRYCIKDGRRVFAWLSRWCS